MSSGNLETLSCLEALFSLSWSKSYCLGLRLSLDDHCLRLALVLTVFVLCLETKTVQDT